MINELTEEQFNSFVSKDLTPHFKSLFKKYMEMQYDYKGDTKEREEYFEKISDKYTKEMIRLAKARLLQDYSLKGEFKYTNVVDAPDMIHFANGNFMIGKFIFREYNHPQMNECGIKGFYVKGEHPISDYNFGVYRLCDIKGKIFSDFDNDIITIAKFTVPYMEQTLLPYMKADFEKFTLLLENRLF